MTRQRYSKKEAQHRILRSLQGKDVPQDTPGTVPGNLLSEDESMSDLAELMAGSLPDETLALPTAIQQAIGSSGFYRGWGGGYNIFVAPHHPNASDANDGFDANNPLATITQAVSIARANRGDTIFILQNDGWQYGSGLSNTISEAVVVPYTKPGLAFVGCGAGSMGVNWEAGATGTFCLDIQAIDTVVQGFNFWGSTTDCHGVRCIWDSGNNYYGENAVIFNCTFSSGIDIGVYLDFSWYNKIYNNSFSECDDYGIYADPAGDSIDYSEVVGNFFDDCGVAMQLGDFGYGLVKGNKILKHDALVSGSSAGEGLDTSNGEKNMITENYFSCPLINWDNFCSGAADDAWIKNFLSDQETFNTPS